MKRLVMAVAAVAMSATMSFAQGQNFNKEPFAVNFQKLSSYLQLTPSQINEVADINEYFIEMQNESLNRASAVRKEKAMNQAVYGNLKLMKEALTPDQYRKYVALINVTNNNNRLQGLTALEDLNLAYAK